MWLLYESLYLIGLLLYLPKAIWRRRLPHRGWSMRLGRYPAPVGERLKGRRSIWIHAVSVGEVQAVRPLVRALAQRVSQDAMVLSTVTPGGFEVASQQMADRGLAIYAPLDVRGCVRRALEVLHPRCLLLVESEFWPTVIWLTKARGIPIAVVNGRISARAFPRYRFVARALAGTFARIDRFLMQSQADAERLIQLGADPASVIVTGNLKWDASLGDRPSPDAVRETAIRLGLNGEEPVIVAGSTHRGEETALLEAFRTVRTLHPSVRLIVAPRHLERVGELVDLIRGAGFTASRFSQGNGTGTWDIGIVDTFGQLPSYYALATIVFIGGSLIPHGGQNPLEAASLGRSIVFGPFMHNFADIARQLTAHQAARQLASPAELTETFQALLTDRTDTLAMGARARALTERSQGAVQRTLDALQPLLSF
ncbi:MAG: 3-deoxy-D-manno-octulosonic acid transferase [Candidatus Omnitrophica bacterium]|nr:3-deoxy-D-manno-octulosonic acid transferase [Candidatus Omnitrophota bacterium]MBI2495209.1 3-deoxy-D-manno-octulosonic acid transferase [Candidatus Omnitrophota bacterium]MBI3020479.1 3-deoxy-D-manno-octulosonic acid transferase [Candidatus Omnitrophota bacterium]